VNVGGEWKMASCEESVIPLIDWCRTAFKNGWIDPDFITRGTGESRDLFAAGSIGVIAYQNSPKHVDLVRQKWETAQPDMNFYDCVGIVPLEGENATYFQYPSFWSETYISPNVDDAKMDRILQIMDWLYSDEGILWTTFGEEGVDYILAESGEIVPARTINEESGKMLQMIEVYPDSEFLSYLAAWNGDMLQYVNPDIPAELRAMCKTEYERRVANWIFPNIDWVVNYIDVPEKADLTVQADTELSQICADSSDTPTEELYQAALAQWNSQGYEACWKAVTAAAAALGK